MTPCDDLFGANTPAKPGGSRKECFKVIVQVYMR